MYFMLLIQLYQYFSSSLVNCTLTFSFNENFNWEMIKEFLSDMLVEEQENKGKSNLKSKYLVWDEDVNE